MTKQKVESHFESRLVLAERKNKQRNRYIHDERRNHQIQPGYINRMTGQRITATTARKSLNITEERGRLKELFTFTVQI